MVPEHYNENSERLLYDQSAEWINEALKGFDRRHADILFSDHAAKDKNLTTADVDCVIDSARHGKIDAALSSEERSRVCFKKYFKHEQRTYFVITERYPDFIKIITVIKKQGKY